MILPPLPNLLLLPDAPPATEPREVLVDGHGAEAAVPTAQPATAPAEPIPASAAGLLPVAPLALLPTAPPANAATAPAAAGGSSAEAGPGEAPAGVAAEPAAAGALPMIAAPEPAPVAAATETTLAGPANDRSAGPAFALPPEDAFPGLAELDAIRAANAGPPAGLDAAERTELAVLLGIGPAEAIDAEQFTATLRALPAPDGDQLLADWLRDAGIDGTPALAGEDWLLG